MRPLWINSLFALVAFLAGIMAFAQEPNTEIFVYLQSDNDLIRVDENGAIISQGEIAFAVWQRIARSTPSTAFHLYYDPNSVGEDTRILRFKSGALIEELRLNETDSSDPRWVEVLLSGNFASDSRRIFVYFGHGEGWRDLLSYDFSAPGSKFNYLNTATILGRHHVDMVIFDACSMAYLETLAAFSDHVQYVVATQFELPIEGIEFTGLEKVLSAPTSDDNAFFVGLYRQIRQDTQDAQKISGLKAPLVLFRLGNFNAFLARFNAWIEAFSDARSSEIELLLRVAHPALRGALQSDSQAVDLRRALKFSADNRTPAFDTVLSSFETLLDEGFGSLQFFMPDSRTKDESGAIAETRWMRRLGNWSLVKKMGEK